MFVKLKKNKSGSFTVQVVESVRIPGSNHPRPRLVKNFGTSASDTAIAQLKLLAQNFIKTESPPQTKPSASGQMLIQSESDINSCTITNSGFNHVFARLFKNIFHINTLKTKAHTMLSQLAIMRIIEPKSKRRTCQLASKFGYDLQLDSIYKLMDRINEKSIAAIQACAYRNTTRLLKSNSQNIDVIFYDLTSIYFETNNDDDLRKFGYSKDGKSQHVQIILAVIVTHYGLPIGYETFPGNIYEGDTITLVLGKLRENYNIKRVIVVADSGLISNNNIDILNAMGLEYVIGARLKCCTRKIISEALKPEGYVQISQDTQGKVYVVKDKEKKASPHQYIFYHSKKRAAKDAYERDEALEKISKHLGKPVKTKLSGALRKAYVGLTSESLLTLDQEKLADAERFDGYFALRSNIKDADAGQILDYYKGLWQVEQTFRISKYNIRIRPIFHYNEARIKAHFALCYIALVLIRTIEFLLRQNDCYMPIEQLLSLLREVNVVSIESHGQSYQLTANFPPELIPIYRALRIPIPHKFCCQ